MSDEVLELDVQVDKKTLNRFLIRNNYMRVGGVFGLLISLAAIAGLVVFWDSFPTSQRVILIVLGLMFTVIQPVSLLMKGWNQLKTGAFRKPFHYVFSDTGMTVENIAGSVEVEWQNIRKVVITKEAIYLYMSALSAFILPKSQCGGKYNELAVLLKEKRK